MYVRLKEGFLKRFQCGISTDDLVPVLMMSKENDECSYVLLKKGIRSDSEAHAVQSFLLRDGAHWYVPRGHFDAEELIVAEEPDILEVLGTPSSNEEALPFLKK